MSGEIQALKSAAATDPGTEDIKAIPGTISGVFSLERLTGCAILVNLTAHARFDYRLLYRVTALAIRTGGMLEVSNEDMAIFAFPNGGFTAFLDEIGLEVKITRTVVSPKERGISKVNIRFQGG